MNNDQTYPTLEQVEKADRRQLCQWHRFLSSADDEHRSIQDRIHERFLEVGGFTPQISKDIGWG